MSSKCNNFLPSLYRMCNNDAPNHRECITWAADGTSFWVSNIECFARDILPIYYKHNNYASFVRQLNMYGFHRSTEPKGKVEPGVQMVEHFTQEYFRRGREDLLVHIHRKTSKMAGKSKAARAREAGLSADERKERAAREQQMQLMQNDIEILKKNQMQLAQTVQGLHQALVTLQQHSSEQAEKLVQLQTGLTGGVKPEVVPVDPYAQLGFGLFSRAGDQRRSGFGAASLPTPDIPAGSSLIELARGDEEEDDPMGAELDGMLGDMQMLSDMQVQGSYFQ